MGEGRREVMMSALNSGGRLAEEPHEEDREKSTQVGEEKKKKNERERESRVAGREGRWKGGRMAAWRTG